MYLNMNLRSDGYSPKLVYFKYFGFSCLLACGDIYTHRNYCPFFSAAGSGIIEPLQTQVGDP